MTVLADAKFCYLTIELTAMLLVGLFVMVKCQDVPKPLVQDTTLRLLPKNCSYSHGSINNQSTAVIPNMRNAPQLGNGMKGAV